MVYINRPRVYEYYVASGGKGDGLSVDSPAGSVNAVKKTVNKYLGKKDEAKVYIIQNTEEEEILKLADKENSSHKMAVWKKEKEEVIEHKAKITVMPYYNKDENTTNKTVYLAFGDKIAQTETLTVSGPTEFKDIVLVPTSSDSNIAFSDKSLKLGDGVAVKSINLKGGEKTEGLEEIELSSSFLKAKLLSSKGNVNLNLNSTALALVELNLDGKVGQNLNIKISKPLKINAKSGEKLSVNGQAQFIVNNATYYEDNNSFENISAGENKYLLYVSPEYVDFIDFTSKAGKFKISQNYTAKAYTKDKKLIATSEKGILDLSSTSGVYNIAVTENAVKATSEFSDYIYYRGYNSDFADTKYEGALANTYAKLTEQKKLKVVYFGGSVTVGAGSSNGGAYSWRALIGEWLKNNFPEADITNCNKGIGETGTHLGAYRVKKAVIDEKPDLLFIEYSINDLYDSASYQRASMQFETIVRQVREQLPECDIVTIMVTEESCAPAAMNDSPQLALHAQALAHEDICQIYNIPTIHVGRALVREIFPDDWQSKKTEIWPLYMTDIVHPTDLGYKAYYSVIKEFFKNTLIFGKYGKCGVTEQEVPFLQNETLLDGNLTFIDPDPNSETNPIYYPEEFKESFVFNPDEIGIIRSDNPEYVGVMLAKTSSEAYLEIKFSGTELIMLGSASESNQYQIQIDGTEWQTKNYAAKNPIVLATELPSGEHTVRIKPALNGDVRISGFYTADSAKATTYKTQ